MARDNQVKPPTILIIDDDEGTRDTLEAILFRDYQLIKAASGKEGLAVLDKHDISLVLLDIRMPGMDGLEVLKEIKRLYSWVMVMIISVVTNPTTVAQVLELGAHDYLTKEFDYDSVRLRCRQLLELREKKLEIISLKSELENRLSPDLVLGPNAVMRKLYENIPDLSKARSPILITGETGTGKELCARYIHSLSPRKDKPFITVNLIAMPAGLVESALFGHKAGAFTGATQGHLGKFKLAQGGTIFLDKIGSMDIHLQGKLLRVLQTGEIEKIGEARIKQVEVKIIAATNTNLTQAIKEGRFRDDLYYRLNTHHIHLPPLRERKDDIPALVNHFIKKYNQEFNRSVEGIEPEALDVLCDYNWPGNIRELESWIERLVLTARGKRLTRVDLFFHTFIPHKEEKEEESIPVDLSLSFKDALHSYEKRYIQELLKRYKGDISASACHARISKSALYEKIKQYRIKS